VPGSAASSAAVKLIDPDVRLMLQVREGNAAAFEELVVRYQDRLVCVLEHLVGSRALAEDLAQEVFLRVYRYRDRYTPDAKFCTYLFTIANHLAANALRDQSRRREVQVVADPSASGATSLDELAIAGSGQLPTRVVDKAELCAMVRQALGALSERQRMAVLLNKFEGMSYAEIAAAMDLTPEAVKSLLARAREHLRQVLEPYLSSGQQPQVD
jgi:RNA polymerase sigma-70 factor (ECF subfamily)